MTTLTGVVAAGVGIGFVTEGLARVARRGAVFRPVNPASRVLPMAAAWRWPELSAAGRQILAIADAQLGKRGGFSHS